MAKCCFIFSGSKTHAVGVQNGWTHGSVLEGREATEFTACFLSFGWKCVLFRCNIVKNYFRNMLCYKLQAQLQRITGKQEKCA